MKTRRSKTEKEKQKTKRTNQMRDEGHVVIGDKLEHRVVYKRHFGPIPERWHVHHIDGVKSNNQPGNLIALPKFLHEEVHRLGRNVGRLPDRAIIENLLTDYRALYQGLKDAIQHDQKLIRELQERVTSRQKQIIALGNMAPIKNGASPLMVNTKPRVVSIIVKKSNQHFDEQAMIAKLQLHTQSQ